MNADSNNQSLPMMAMKEIPTPSPNAQRIVALVKERGKVSGYQLADGRVLEKSEAIQLARHGGIQGVGISSRKGNEYLKSIPDQWENNNLGGLPSISSSSGQM